MWLYAVIEKSLLVFKDYELMCYARVQFDVRSLEKKTKMYYTLE